MVCTYFLTGAQEFCGNFSFLIIVLQANSILENRKEEKKKKKPEWKQQTFLKREDFYSWMIYDLQHDDAVFWCDNNFQPRPKDMKCNEQNLSNYPVCLPSTSTTSEHFSPNFTLWTAFLS